MGGCASRPRELKAKDEALLPEDATTPKKAEGETVAPQEENGGETKKEEPSVDTSEAAPKSEEAESKPAEAEAGSGEAAAKPTEDKVEAAVETKEPAAAKEEEEKKKVEGGGEVKPNEAAVPSSACKS